MSKEDRLKDLYVRRDVSWMYFNHRILQEAKKEEYYALYLEEKESGNDESARQHLISQAVASSFSNLCKSVIVRHHLILLHQSNHFLILSAK